MTGIFLTGIFLLLLILFFLRSSWERKHPVVTKYHICSNRIPKAFHGARILFLSDLHGDSYGRENETLIRLMQEEHPDLILFGGDMMTVKKWCRSGETLAPLRAILEAFSGKVPMYYAYGNHESRMRDQQDQFPGWYRQFCDLLNRYGVIRLRKEPAEIEREGEKILLSGIDFPKIAYYERKRKKLPPAVFGKMPKKGDIRFRIVLAHSPLYLPDLSRFGADLVLSGHFHGGTIRIPVLGGVMTPQGQFFSRYSKGRVREGNTEEIISGGLGTHSINIRFLNRPELVSLILERKVESSES